MKINLSISQNLSLQLRTAIALEKGIEEIHELVKSKSDLLTEKPFIRDVQAILLRSNKKLFFRNDLPSDYFLRYDKPLLEKALMFASERHNGEYRESGTPYLAHVLSTGFILARLGMPKEVIISGILHDAVEDTPDKNTIMNQLYYLSPSVTWLVYGVSGPDIKDAIEKDKILLSKIQSISINSGSLFPKIIKCADAIANLYDLEFMKAKDGRTATERQKLFLTKTADNILPFARQIDEENIIPMRKRNEVFSLSEYIEGLLSEK